MGKYRFKDEIFRLLSQYREPVFCSDHFFNISGRGLSGQILKTEGKIGVKFANDLHQKLRVQKRFSILDPNGLFIDIVQQVESQAHCWDQYMN